MAFRLTSTRAMRTFDVLNCPVNYMPVNFLIDTNILLRLPNNFADAQHYGMKTRLLDWTGNPLTALWFACSNEFKKDNDSVVYMLKNAETFSDNGLRKICKRMQIPVPNGGHWARLPVKRRPPIKLSRRYAGDQTIELEI